MKEENIISDAMLYKMLNESPWENMQRDSENTSRDTFPDIDDLEFQE